MVPATDSAGRSLDQLRGRYIELANTLGGEFSAAMHVANKSLAAPELKPAIAEYEKLEKTISKLSDKPAEFEIRVEYDQVRSFEEAQEEAAKQSEELLGFVEKLSIISPFETAQVELVTRIGLAAGFSADEVKGLAGAFLDMAATQGIASSELAFAFDQFTQLRKLGRITQIDLRQLRRLGIDVARVLGIEMGMSVEEFNEQVKESPELMDQLFDSFVKFSGEVSAGAAQRMARTLPGLMSTAHDIIEIGSRNLFRPMIEAVSPAVGETLDKLAELVTGPKMEAIGMKLSDAVQGGLALLQGDITGVATALLQLGMPLEKVEKIVDTFFRLQEIAGNIRIWLVEGWERLQPILQDFAENIMPELNRLWAELGEAWAIIQPELKELGEALGIVGGDMTFWGTVAALLSEILDGVVVSIGQLTEAIEWLTPKIVWIIDKVTEAVEIFKQLKAVVDEVGVGRTVGEILSGAATGIGLEFQQGGIVPGPIGAPQMAVVHGGETITPAGGNTTVTVPVYLDGEMIANVVAPILGSQAKQMRRASVGGSL
jgi:hypothetical protein